MAGHADKTVKDYKCDICGKQLNLWLRGAFLNLKNEINMGVYFDILLPDGVNPADVLDRIGLLIWDADSVPSVEDATIDNCDYVLNNSNAEDPRVAYTNRFEAYTYGIPAKNIGDKLSFRAYYIDENGEYHYSQIQYDYAPSTYCYNRIKKSTDAKEVAVNIAILNYCTAAQRFFHEDSGYDYVMTEAINKDLTPEQKVLNWDASLVRSDWSVPAEKQINVAKNEAQYAGLKYTFGANLTLKGAIDYMFYFSVKDAAGKMIELTEVKAYMWTTEEYDATEELTIEGRESYTMVNNGRYEYTFKGRAAKDMFEPLYVCVVAKDAAGNEYISGVQPYCPERFSYMNYNKASNAEVYRELAKWMVVYGDAARAFFS